MDSIVDLRFVLLEIEKNTELREVLRSGLNDVSVLGKRVHQILQSLHVAKDSTDDKKICAEAEELLCGMRSRFFQLQQRVPLDQFYRYNDLWKWSAIQLVFSAALIQFTLRGTLISSGEIDRLLDCAIGDEQTTGKHIDIEEYLLGLCQLSQFLARLTVNSVIAGRLQRPSEVLAFLSELLGAFMGFSFRNDQLRKRFDGMKYDVMKVEEVVYDLSVRGFPIVSAEAGVTALDPKKRPKVET